MGIMTRFTRLFKADIHGVMDQIENKELVLKQCLREMEASLGKKQREWHRLGISLDQLKTETRQVKQERDKIEQDLKIAIQKGKEDIARLLIKKGLKIDQHLDASGRQAESIEKQMAMLAQTIDGQKHQYAEMQIRSESFLLSAEHQKWAETTSPIIAQPPWYLISDEEIELELIKHKEAMAQGGGDA